MSWQDLITADPRICHGQACFKGTRIMVSVVLDNLAEGTPGEQILHRFPSLDADHIRAALAYAADLARERTVPIPA